MSGLYGEICAKVSQRYHRRVNEILTVLDGKVDYVVKHTTNLSVMKNMIESFMDDRDGYIKVDTTVSTLNGIVITYPKTKISGDFVVVLVKHRKLNPNSGKTSITNNVLVYEKGVDITQKIRSGV
jgi:hypothetical protein